MSYEQDDADPGQLDDSPRLPKHERDYVIPAQDGKGHSIRLQCRAMPSVGRLIADVHSSKKYPFRTQGDLQRWAIVYGVKLLAAGAGIKSVMMQADAMISVLQDEEYQLQFLDFFNHLRRVVEVYVEAKSPKEAKRVVAKARSQIEAMEEGYWKGRYREELLARHSALLDDDAHRVSWGAHAE